MNMSMGFRYSRESFKVRISIAERHGYLHERNYQQGRPSQTHGYCMDPSLLAHMDLVWYTLRLPLNADEIIGS